MYYYLLDLERTIGNGIATYWNQARRGYAIHLDDAGLFNEETAEEIVQSDIDKWTVKVSQRQIEKIFD